MDTLKTLIRLREAYTPFPLTKHVKEWKDKGGKVIGWLCTYIPEELIYACGALPFRVMGDPELESSSADSYLYASNCSFAKSCLELRIKGSYDFLDGLVAGNTCDHIRRLFDIWALYFNKHFTHILDIPRKITEEAYSFYKMELMDLKIRLENYTGSEISEDSLVKAIKIYNKSRILLKELYNLKKEKNPKISGTEFLEVIKASTVMPREEFNELLEELLEEVAGRKQCYQGKARLLITGAVLDNPRFIKSIEDIGGLVVADELCTGSRYFWDLVDETIGPMEALSKRYLKGPICARMPFMDDRIRFLEELVKEFLIDGVICPVIKFCDTYGHDLPRMINEIEKKGLPTLFLDLEYGGGSSIGQVRTRVEAFIEMLGGKV